MMNNKLEAQTLTENPTGNLCCHVFTSHALNMSCSFGHSACSIECRYMVINENIIQNIGIKLNGWNFVQLWTLTDTHANMLINIS